MRFGLVLLTLVLGASSLFGQDWQGEFARMPLRVEPQLIVRTNSMQIMLAAFQRNPVVKALIFMPATTDEYYFFKRANFTLTNANPSLLDAVVALTNQTSVRLEIVRGMMRLYMPEDLTEHRYEVVSEQAVGRLKSRRFAEHVYLYDRDWDYLLPALEKRMDSWFTPGRKDPNSYHFYRHSIAAWDLTCWEMLEAAALAGRSSFTVDKRQIRFVFDGARSPRPKPVR
jgi:phosphoenolpyruvate synthase/pyruvate phosphate dikinase